MSSPSATASGPCRILVLCPQLTTGGEERQMLVLAKHLDRRRYAMSVLYYETAGDVLQELHAIGVPVVHLDRARLGSWGLLRAMRKEIRRQRPDVLHCRLPSGYRFGRLAALGAGVPVVIAEEGTVHCGSWMKRLVDGLFNLWTDAWIGNSRAVVDHVIADLYARPAKVHLVYNGIDAEAFRSRQQHPLLQRVRGQGRRIVLNLGNLSRAKNQRLFLRLGVRLRQRFPEVALALCGDGDLRADLEAYAAQLGLAPHCHFLGLQKDVPGVLASADLFVQTSDWEGLPNAVIEAMAAGLPVVATDAGGTRELIDDGVHGFLVPVGDEDALLARVSQVLADPDLARRLGQAAHERVATQFSAQTLARTYCDLVERLLAGLPAGKIDPRPPAGPSQAAPPAASQGRGP
jgi:glycosyltransferase involved in cell wall biosynthesis